MNIYYIILYYIIYIYIYEFNDKNELIYDPVSVFEYISSFQK